ncbi:DNA polymerase subunit beta [Roseofilum reptotaenium AO1-A]|uniref:DNA polymerase subunit beta n=1 Tax=Roseofilum reptotaenium AO1-A TaxID=1925591 RepID=A0A1L9QQQ0_9CYAN|nr:DNA polymerase subunit beta [Roseofilum reptotaenium AO1-A]
MSDPLLSDRLGITPKQLADFCPQWGIVELSVFGSILREDFKPDSDIDLLVVFDPNFRSRMSLMDLVKIQYQLEDGLGRQVDLIEKSSVIESDNWIRRQNILSTAQVIYESGRILFV